MESPSHHTHTTISNLLCWAFAYLDYRFVLKFKILFIKMKWKTPLTTCCTISIAKNESLVVSNFGHDLMTCRTITTTIYSDVLYLNLYHDWVTCCIRPLPRLSDMLYDLYHDRVTCCAISTTTEWHVVRPLLRPSDMLYDRATCCTTSTTTEWHVVRPLPRLSDMLYDLYHDWVDMLYDRVTCCTISTTIEWHVVRSLPRLSDMLLHYLYQEWVAFSFWSLSQFSDMLCNRHQRHECAFSNTNNWNVVHPCRVQNCCTHLACTLQLKSRCLL